MKYSFTLKNNAAKLTLQNSSIFLRIWSAKKTVSCLAWGFFLALRPAVKYAKLKQMKYSLSNATEFGWSGIKAKAISSKDDFPGASAAYFEVTGSHGRVKTECSDRIYLVLEGTGEFDVDGKIVSVIKDDVVIVPKNTPYDYKATDGTTLKLYLVHTPAYDKKFEKKVD